jgi:hypothetical protein
MGKRFGRKKTRELKEQAMREAIGNVIRTGLAGGEQFRHVANRISMDFHLDKDKAIKMVMEVYKDTTIHKSAQETTMEFDQKAINI